MVNKPVTGVYWGAEEGQHPWGIPGSIPIPAAASPSLVQSLCTPAQLGRDEEYPSPSGWGQNVVAARTQW